jgi:hypothetical protein
VEGFFRGLDIGAWIRVLLRGIAMEDVL